MKKLSVFILAFAMLLFCAALAEEAQPWTQIADGVYQINGSGLLVVGEERAAQINPNPRNQDAAAAVKELAGERELVTLSTSAASDAIVDLGGVVLEPIAIRGSLSGTVYLDAERQILIAGNLLGNGTADLSRQYIGSDVAGYINGYRGYLESLDALSELVTDQLCIVANGGVQLDHAYFSDLHEAVRLFVEASHDITLVYTPRVNSVGDFTVTVGSASILVHMPFGGLYGYDLGGTTLCTADSDYRFYITDYGKFKTIRDTDIQSCYLLMDDTTALLIDCDMYNGPLFWETVFAAIGDRELSVYITHQHGDHINNLEFVDADRVAHIYWPKDEPAPGRGFNPLEAENLKDKVVLLDYDTPYTLGGRELVIHKMTAHTPGGSVVVDRTDRVLFTGDATGTQTFRGGTNTGRLTAQEYIDEVRELQALYGDEFDDIYQAHNYYSTPHVLEYMVTAAQWVIDNGTDGLINGMVYLYNGQVLDAEAQARIFGNEMFDSQNYYAFSLAIGQTAREALEAEQPAAAEEAPAYVPAWADQVPEGDSYTSMSGAESVAYFAAAVANQDLFTEYTFENENKEIGDITYFVYDPTQHGFEAGGNYPVVVWFHGGGNGADGRMAIFEGGAAGMAGEEAQATIGGMYIICPLGNENMRYSWPKECVESVHTLVRQVIEANGITGPVLIAGTSAGGLMCDYYAEAYHDELAGIFWMSTTIPDAETVRAYSDEGIRMWFEVSLHDETGAFTNSFPNGDTSAYEDIENFELTAFEWIRWGDKTIASLNVGVEFGQHCSCSQANRNFIFDDGTPDDPAHPDGLSGWFRDVVNAAR